MSDANIVDMVLNLTKSMKRKAIVSKYETCMSLQKEINK